GAVCLISFVVAALEIDAAGRILADRIVAFELREIFQIDVQIGHRGQIWLALQVCYGTKVRVTIQVCHRAEFGLNIQVSRFRQVHVTFQVSESGESALAIRITYFAIRSISRRAASIALGARWLG
ncbi:MAG TPA: hypothetical protein VF940_26945, partial [Streptosporangiaceae bacterium]